MSRDAALVDDLGEAGIAVLRELRGYAVRESGHRHLGVAGWAAPDEIASGERWTAVYLAALAHRHLAEKQTERTAGVVLHRITQAGEDVLAGLEARLSCRIAECVPAGGEVAEQPSGARPIRPAHVGRTHQPPLFACGG